MVLAMGLYLAYAHHFYTEYGNTFGLLASYHAFPAAYLIDKDGRILARAEATDAPAFVSPPPTVPDNASR